MAVAPGPLTRTFTAPVPASHSRLPASSSSSINHHHSQPSSNFSSYRASDSTQATNASTLFPQPPATNPSFHGSGLVGASDNVINRVADKETSLFQFCIGLKNRLLAVPGFEEHLKEAEETHADEDVPADPVTLLWTCFRRGYPLMDIYNTLDPSVPLEVDESKVSANRREKAAAFKFLQACVDNLKIPTAECFILSDLYGEDTSGFVKVARLVSRVVDILLQHGMIEEFDEDDTTEGGSSQGKRTQRQHIVDELVRTERTYVQHLEVLHAFKKHVEQCTIIPGDAIHDIFLNLNALLDFQRRFLIRVEQMEKLHEDDQNWGQLFKTFGTAFRVYEQYIANQKTCEDTAMREYEKLREIDGPPEMKQMVESPTHLTSFLLKPFQRLSKYPLLLKELRDKGDLDEERRNDLTEGIEVCQLILERTNAYLDLQDRRKAVQDLKTQVEDWKDHKLEAFGDLLLHGTFIVFKSDAAQTEREYRMYLFERILLCCKDITNKPKNKIMNKPASTAPAKGKPKMAMKGRIFMQNVTETIFMTKPGNYTCQIMWKGDSAIEYFIVKFPTEEIMKKWRNSIEEQRRKCQQRARQKAERSSETELSEPQYRQHDSTDSEATTHGYNEQAELLSSRHGSSTSLRSRSTTGESGPPIPQTQAKLNPGKLSLGTNPPLTLRTQQLQNNASTPQERIPAQGSYFSPGAESPLSSRTSSSSGMVPFPRQQTPSNGFHADETNRFTAPAPMTRPLTNGSQNGYAPSDARTGRSTQPVGVPVHGASLSHTRLRSASSPDVHSQNNSNRRTPSNAPPVPNVPAYITQQSGSVNRSQSNSPIYANGVPPRSAAASPNSKLSSGEYRGPAPYPQPNAYEGAGDQAYPPPIKTQWGTGTISPPLSTGYSLGESPNPTNFKVKVEVPSEGSTMTLVVGYNISYQSLKDRIDAKLQRHTNLSLASGSVRLQYLYDDEMVSIQTDEDVQTAFETWKEHQRSSFNMSGQLGEIKLYCNR